MKTGSPSKTSRQPRAKAAPLAALLATAPSQARRSYEKWLAAVTALEAAPRNRKRRTARVWARRLGVQPQTLWTKRSQYRVKGKIALLDKRFSGAYRSGPRPGLPPLAIQHLRALAQDDGLSVRQVIQLFSDQLARWKKGDAKARVPGYANQPKGNPPPGWSQRNLARYLAPHPRKASERILFEITLRFHANGTATWSKQKVRP